MVDINVRLDNKTEDGWIFEVEVIEGGSQTRHEVALNKEDYKRLVGDKSPEELIKKSFEFLLLHEPKESILSKFNLMDIAKYFPEFEEKIK